MVWFGFYSVNFKILKILIQTISRSGEQQVYRYPPFRRVDWWANQHLPTLR